MNLSTLIIKLSEHNEFDIDEELVKKYKKEYAKANKLNDLPTNIQLFRNYNELKKLGTIKANQNLENILIKRKVRSLSGIVPIQVLTKPYKCPGKCIFCPNDASMPKSYINTEPGAMRALLNDFDPYKQVYNRLLSLNITGHNIEKIEMIVLGGCFDTYPIDYKIDFVKSCYDACNNFDKFQNKVKIDEGNPKAAKFTVDDDLDIQYPKTLQDTLKINESARCKIIGLTIETRPDYVNDKNCKFWRSLGVTRIEIGVQSLFDTVLKANLRDNTVDQIRKSFHKLRQYGFKISAHFMPGLYKSTIKKDIDTIKKAFEDPYLRPDEIKFYPTSVIVNTKLFDLHKDGKYKALETKDIQNIIEEIKLKYIPPYTRLKRIIRDIPANEVYAGSNVTNLRQLVMNKMKKEFLNDKNKRTSQYSRLYENIIFVSSLGEMFGLIKGKGRIIDSYETFIMGNSVDNESKREFVCLCTRCREVKNKDKSQINNVFLVIRKFSSSVGQEYFLSMEDRFGYLYGFLRLLLPDSDEAIEVEGLGKQTGIVRELHVYGQSAKIREKDIKKTQHKGYGIQLLENAELIAKNFGYTKISVISGIGVRNYYKKLGYEIEGEYVVKDLR